MTDPSSGSAPGAPRDPDFEGGDHGATTRDLNAEWPVTGEDARRYRAWGETPIGTSDWQTYGSLQGLAGTGNGGFAAPDPAISGYGTPDHGTPDHGTPDHVMPGPGMQGYGQQVPPAGNPPPSGYVQGYAGPMPPPPAGPAGGSSGVRTALLVAALIVVIALGAGAVWWFALRDEDTGGTSASGSAGRGGSRGSDANTVTKCRTLPTLTFTNADIHAGSLRLTMSAEAACGSGDILASEDLTVNVTDASGGRIATGHFDVSSSPIAIPGSDNALTSTNLVFDFPEGTYWYPVDMISAEGVDVGITESGSGSVPPELPLPAGDSTTVGSADIGKNPRSMDESASEDALRAIERNDKPAVRSRLEHQWVPQLSSKQPGLHAEGITWKNADILREHLAFRAKYPEALLVWSGDWGSFDLRDWWVTMSGVRFGSPDDALAWCRDERYDADHCIAKLIRNGSSTGTTRYNR